MGSLLLLCPLTLLWQESFIEITPKEEHEPRVKFSGEESPCSIPGLRMKLRVGGFHQFNSGIGGGDPVRTSSELPYLGPPCRRIWLFFNPGRASLPRFPLWVCEKWGRIEAVIFLGHSELQAGAHISWFLPLFLPISKKGAQRTRKEMMIYKLYC